MKSNHPTIDPRDTGVPAKSTPPISRPDSGKQSIGFELWATSGPEAWLFDNTITAITLDLIKTLPDTMYFCPTFWNSYYRKQKHPPKALSSSFENWCWAFVPVYGNSPRHWSFALIDRFDAKCYFYDSFHKAPTKDTQAGLREIWATLRSDVPLVIECANHAKIDKQVDSFNCGVYVLRFIEELYLDPYSHANVEVRSSQLQDTRLKWARKLCPRDEIDDRKRKRPAETPIETVAVSPVVKKKTRIAEPVNQVQLPAIASENFINTRSSVYIDQINEWKKSDSADWNQFENICSAFLQTDAAQPPKPIESEPITREKGTQTMHVKPSVVMEKCHEFDKKEASFIQKLFYRSRKKAVARILGEKPIRCAINIETVRKFFADIMAAKEIDEDTLVKNAPIVEAIDNASAERLVAPISPREVVSTLSRAANTAPGEDKLQYRDLRKLDPRGETLAAIYSICIEKGRIPNAWKHSSTVLLYKKGDVDDLSNWRPISIMVTVYKLYTSILSRRLNDCIGLKKKLDAPDLITSHEQVGFEQTEGCSEHIFELQSCLNNAIRNRFNLYVCFLDLSNAFGSIPHQVIHLMLRRLGLGARFSDIVNDMYSGATMSVKTTDAETDKISIDSGVKQGDPLSPTLFCVALEYLLRNMRSKFQNYGYSTSPEMTTHVLAYADDLAIVCKSPAELRSSLCELSRLADICCLKFKPSKCATLSIRAGRLAVNSFEIQGKPMPSLNQGEFYTYLGAPIGVGLSTSSLYLELFTKAQGDVLRVAQSALAPWQKIQVFKSFILPRFFYHMSHTSFMAANIESFDKLLRSTAKQVLNLKKMAANEYIQLSNSFGGVGLMSLHDAEAITTVSHFFRLLTSKRNRTRRLAISMLRQEVADAVERDPTDRDIASHLNCTSNCVNAWKPGTTFERFRRAFYKLSKKFDLTLEYQNDEIALKIKSSDGIERSIGANERHLVHRTLRTHHSLALRRDLLAHEKQGSAMNLILKDRSSYRCISDARHLSFGAYKFMHSARLQLLALNSNHSSSGRPRNCRRCQYPIETVLHVLGNCPVHLYGGEYTARHNAVQDMLVESIKKFAKAPLQIAIDKVCSVVPGLLRPDIIVRNEKEKRIFIIDVTCPTETAGEQAFINARLTKIHKYKHIHDHYKAQGYQVILDAFIVGSLGSFDPMNNDLLRELGIPLRAARSLARRMVAICLEHSKDTYWRHIIGERFKKRTLRGGAAAPEPTTPRYTVIETLKPFRYAIDPPVRVKHVLCVIVTDQPYCFWWQIEFSLLLYDYHPLSPPLCIDTTLTSWP